MPDVVLAPVWGLVRSVQSEHPGRFVLVDIDDTDTDIDWAALIGLDEPQVAVRGGGLLVPRLVRADARERAGCRFVAARCRTPGSLEGLAIVARRCRPTAAAGEVRIAVRAAGLNFRDVLIALGMYPGDAPLGSEAAGVVVEVGAGVTDLAPGDRVMGLVMDGFGSLAVTDRRMLVRMPAGWSFVEAAFDAVGVPDRLLRVGGSGWFGSG